MLLKAGKIPSKRKGKLGIRDVQRMMPPQSKERNFSPGGITYLPARPPSGKIPDSEAALDDVVVVTGEKF